MRKWILPLSIVVLLSAIHASYSQTPLAPPLPQGTTYSPGLFASDTGFGILGCTSAEVPLADGSGCAPFSTIGGLPGGVNGNEQYKNGGAFSGATLNNYIKNAISGSIDGMCQGMDAPDCVNYFTNIMPSLTGPSYAGETAPSNNVIAFPLDGTIQGPVIWGQQNIITYADSQGTFAVPTPIAHGGGFIDTADVFIKVLSDDGWAVTSSFINNQDVKYDGHIATSLQDAGGGLSAQFVPTSHIENGPTEDITNCYWSSSTGVYTDPYGCKMISYPDPAITGSNAASLALWAGYIINGSGYPASFTCIFAGGFVNPAYCKTAFSVDTQGNGAFNGDITSYANGTNSDVNLTLYQLPGGSDGISNYYASQQTSSTQFQNANTLSVYVPPVSAHIVGTASFIYGSEGDIQNNGAVTAQDYFIENNGFVSGEQFQIDDQGNVGIGGGGMSGGGDTDNAQLFVSNGVGSLDKNGIGVSSQSGDAGECVTIDSSGFHVPSGVPCAPSSTPSLGTCPGGTISGTASGFKVTGITLGTSACIVNFSPALNIGGCTALTNTAAATISLTSISTTSATFTFSATTTEIYAQCF